MNIDFIMSFIGHSIFGFFFAGLVVALFGMIAWMVNDTLVGNAYREKRAILRSEWNKRKYYPGMWTERNKAENQLEEQYTKLEETINKWIVAICIICSIILGCIYGYPCAKIKYTPWEHNNYVTHQIVNLVDNSEVKGNFRGRYVRGYIGETTTYHYYYRMADGGMKLQKAGEATTTIYPSETKPRAEWYEKTRKVWWLSEEEFYCKIYVPEGTVTTEFVIDMQ